jgi:hypothetical protein
MRGLKKEKWKSGVCARDHARRNRNSFFVSSYINKAKSGVSWTFLWLRKSFFPLPLSAGNNVENLLLSPGRACVCVSTAIPHTPRHAGAGVCWQQRFNLLHKFSLFRAIHRITAIDGMMM